MEKLFEVKEEGPNWKIFTPKVDVTLEWPIPYEEPNSSYWPPLQHPDREREIEWLWEISLEVKEVKIAHSAIFIKKYSHQEWPSIERELQKLLKECFSEKGLMLKKWRESQRSG